MRGMTECAATVFQKTDGHVETELNGNVVLLSIGSGRYYNLNDTASDVWRRIDGGRSVAEVSAELAAEYDADLAVIQEGVASIIDEWLEEGLVRSLT